MTEFTEVVLRAEIISSTLFWVYVAITAASVSYSVLQAQKMKDAAKKAAEARKGYEIPIEGIAGNIPICYGRVLIGGIRVYHQTKGNFEYKDSGSDKVFLAGLNSIDIDPYEFYLDSTNPIDSYAPGQPNYKPYYDVVDIL
jgi:hypothetical protein